ncbi:hypothetical protein KSP40_PGU020283 [Platanthera guangdongensis]|uniref:Non-haem dioxygenase N-terminal domain-containing protein n=1 Tax=Platanthera guangdongensis TaxID=2320717 RepID=A0ABR2LIN1_9ASPA
MDVTGVATSHTIAGSSAPLAVETIAIRELPAVDFSLLVNGTPNQRSEIIRNIGEFCSEWGCFSLINHGVPEIVRSSMVEAFREFFDLTVEERKELMGKKIFDPIRHEAGLNTTTEGQQYWRDFVRIFVHPAFHSPSQPPHFSFFRPEDIACLLLGLMVWNLELAASARSGGGGGGGGRGWSWRRSS